MKNYISIFLMKFLFSVTILKVNMYYWKKKIRVMIICQLLPMEQNLELGYPY